MLSGGRNYVGTFNWTKKKTGDWRRRLFFVVVKLMTSMTMMMMDGGANLVVDRAKCLQVWKIENYLIKLIKRNLCCFLKTRLN